MRAKGNTKMMAGGGKVAGKGKGGKEVGASLTPAGASQFRDASFADSCTAPDAFVKGHVSTRAKSGIVSKGKYHLKS